MSEETKCNRCGLILGTRHPETGDVLVHLDCRPVVAAALLAEREQFANWTPTSDNINALPAGIREYIYVLETRADPSGELRELVLGRDEIKALGIALTAEREKVRKLSTFLRTIRHAPSCAVTVGPLPLDENCDCPFGGIIRRARAALAEAGEEAK